MKEKKLNIKIWKKVFKEFDGYKITLALVIFLSIIGGVFELAAPKISEFVIDNFAVKKDLTFLVPIIVIGLLIALGNGLCTFLIVYIGGFMEEKIANKVREKCFIKLQALSLSFFDKNSVGTIMSKINSDIPELFSIIIWSISEGLLGIGMMVAIIIAMFHSNIKLALIVCIIFPLIALLVIALYKKILTAQRKVKQINGDITSAYNEDIQGVKTTKTLVREKLNEKDFYSTTQKMKEASVKAIVLSALLSPMVQIITFVIQGAVIAYGGTQVLSDVLKLGTLAAFLVYIKELQYPILDTANIFSDILSGQAAAERIFNLMETPSEIKDSEEVIKKYGASTNPTNEKCLPIVGNIRFESVSFSYKDNEPVLHDFNLEVKAGETIALVGATGSGKSTIANLFCRFYEPTSGRILIDGIDYTKMPERWIHENLGYVLQSPHLFSGSILENIKYGKPDATDEEIITAAKMSNAHDFIQSLPNGYDTEVGEGGALLSSGQKQLVSFARAIIRNPRLFVLDEATSSIDTKTEHKIQKCIEQLLKGRTSFVIAHRLSTIQNADKILVIAHGKIVESGTHEQLLAKKGEYHKLYMQQFLDELIK